MVKLTEIAELGPRVSALIDEFGHSILEQRAELADRAINDKLLLELVMRYVQAERQLHELNDLKNKFLGIAAHDLRNPLSAVRGMSELLLEVEMDGAQRKEFYEAMYRASNEMLRLVNDLLDVSVIESGKLEMRLKKGSMAQLIRARMKLLAPAAEAKAIRLEPVIPDLSESMFDPDRLAQVVDNLLSNAIKFSPAGSVIRVTLAERSNAIALSVRDQGPGLSAEDREKLFGTFQKLSAQPTGGEKSTGLGLAIVKKIVDAHGGSIVVTSEPGTGAEFTVTLPAGGKPGAGHE